MAVFTNDADQTGLASGTTLTVANSGGGTNTALSAITGTVTVDNGAADTGTLSYLHATTTATASQLRWNFTGVTSCAARIYVYLTGYPSTGAVTLLELGTTGANTVNVRSSGKLYASTVGGAGSDSTAVVPLNTWVRLEMAETVAASGATVSADYYLGESTTPVQNLLSTTAGNTGSTAVSAVRFGKVSSAGNLTAFRTDAIAFAPGQSTYIGPAGTAPALVPVSGSVAAASTSSANVSALLATSGTAPATTGQTTAVTSTQGISGSVAGASTTTASVATRLAVAGSIAAQSGATLTVGQLQPAAGSVAATSAAAGAVNVISGSVQQPVTGTAQATSGATAAVGVTAAVAGVVPVASGTTAFTTARLAVMASVVAAVNVSAAASVRGSVSGAVEALSGSSAQTASLQSVAGTIAATSSASAVVISGELRDITATATLDARSYRARLEPRRVSATLTPRRWTARQP